MTAQLLFAALVTGAVYALIAVSLNLIYGTMRLLNVAHGDLVMIGAYLGYWSFELLGLPPSISLVGTVAVAATLGWVAYRGLFARVLRQAKTTDRLEANSLLVFFGLSIVAQNLAALWFTGTPRGYSYATEILQIGDIAVTGARLIALVVSLTAVVGVVLFFRYTIWGLAVRALIQSRDASALVGIDVGRVFAVSSALGFALAMATGTLIGMYETVTPFMGSRYTMAAFVVIILGGLGNLTGSLIGGLMLGVLETVGVSLAGANYRSILLYGVFIAVLVWRPEGLFGARVRL